jgi:hypothetical protein
LNLQPARGQQRDGSCVNCHTFVVFGKCQAVLADVNDVTGSERLRFTDRPLSDADLAVGADWFNEVCPVLVPDTRVLWRNCEAVDDDSAIGIAADDTVAGWQRKNLEFTVLE